MASCERSAASETCSEARRTRETISRRVVTMREMATPNWSSGLLGVMFRLRSPLARALATLATSLR
ncbi:hypothetical protein D3C78_1671280 [compost metagenome]